MSASNKMEAAKNPMKWRAVGLPIILIISAMSPTNVAVPIFWHHHTARISAEKPMRSQAKGRWKIWKKAGDIIKFKTPHNAAKIVIPAKSRVPKYNGENLQVTLFCRNVTPFRLYKTFPLDFRFRYQCRETRFQMLCILASLVRWKRCWVWLPLLLALPWVFQLTAWFSWQSLSQQSFPGTCPD